MNAGRAIAPRLEDTCGIAEDLIFGQPQRTPLYRVASVFALAARVAFGTVHWVPVPQLLLHHVPGRRFRQGTLLPVHHARGDR